MKVPPAARASDMHVCPMVTGIVPHVGGPILPPCSPTVLIGFLPAARVTDMATCVGPPDIIVKGSPTVMINNLMAARVGDLTAHGGNIILGCFTVIIGEVGMGVPSVALFGIATAVNPLAGTINCGNIIDAVISRLSGADPLATASATQDGTFEDIGQRHGTQIEWGHSFQDSFSAVSDGGDGTIAILGIQYSGGTASHVVVIANDHGTVGIVEGQDWGAGNPPEVITTPQRANERYNPDGGSDVGIGIVRAGR